MLGDELIIGHSEGKITDKYRIFLPSFTGVEISDIVIFQKTSFEEELALKIIAYKSYLEIIERLKKLRNNAKSFEEYKNYSQEIEKICFQLDSKATVDNQKRLILPKNIVEEYNWVIGDTVYYDGLGESVLVRKKNK